jgi:glycyl-tRNA synthetase alpha subunit
MEEAKPKEDDTKPKEDELSILYKKMHEAEHLYKIQNAKNRMPFTERCKLIPEWSNLTSTEIQNYYNWKKDNL